MASTVQAAQSSPRPRVLVVDDEPAMLELVADVVGRETNCQMFSARDLREARKILDEQPIDLMLADVRESGFRRAAQLHAEAGAARLRPGSRAAYVMASAAASRRLQFASRSFATPRRVG